MPTAGSSPEEATPAQEEAAQETMPSAANIHASCELATAKSACHGRQPLYKLESVEESVVEIRNRHRS